jgi:hypothetical protein
VPASGEPKAVFHPDFLARLRGVSTLRFMDWGRTNGSDIEHWEGRATPTMPQGGYRGVSFELMIDLANETDTDAWINVPHRADDRYVEELAKLVKARLSPKHRVYIEYSNEIWNGIFPQLNWSNDKGCALGLNKVGVYRGDCEGGSRYWAGMKWQARRSGEIFAIFQKVFGGCDRLVRVLAGQSSNPDLNENLLRSFYDEDVNPKKGQVDALAVAPYIGAELAMNLVHKKQHRAITPSELAARLQGCIAKELHEPTAKNKAIADKFGARLIAYEAGQHLIAQEQAQNDESFINKLIDANRDAQMRAVYTAMFDDWLKTTDNDLMMVFTYIERPTKFGTWGLLESQVEPTEHSPKYQAFRAKLDAMSAAH